MGDKVIRLQKWVRSSFVTKVIRLLEINKSMTDEIKQTVLK